MKRFTQVVLMLCITMMCASPFEVQGQNRRTSGNTGNTTATQKEQAQTKTATNRSSNSSNQNAAIVARPQPQQQVQDRRTTPSRSGNTSTATTSRSSNNQPKPQPNNKPSNNQPVTKPNNQPNNRTSNMDRPNNSSRINPSGNMRPEPKPQPRPQPKAQPAPPRPKPAAVQYHSNIPPKRGPEYHRPYLEPKHKPMPSYSYGDHNFGYRLRTLPRGYSEHRFGTTTYYYFNGIWYRKYLLGGYYVCRPPRGSEITSTLMNVALTVAVINTIKDELSRAKRAERIATVYSTKNNGYVTRGLDNYYESISAQANQEYYYQDGVFYILHNGSYYVIEPPIGALVTQIPEDYEELELDGRTYYLVEETLYKATVIDGALYFEVVSNL